MSTEANQPELPNGAVAPEPATPSERDPDLHSPNASAIQSDDVPPAADDAVNSNAVQSNEVQSDDAEDSQPDHRSVQSGDAGDPVTSISDPKIQDPDGRTSLSSGTADGDGKLARTFTMRELLDELKKDDRNEEMQAGSPQSQDSMQQHLDQSNAAMDLINKVTGTDEEGQSRQRILTYAAKRYANAIERNPNDFDALYNWALILQESADNVSPGSSSTSRDALLEEACKKYEEATHICPTLYDAYYNWSIAISDRAKMRGRTKEAEELWKQASRNYEKAVQLNWNSPQAFNNWGLALQELSAIVPAREKPIIVKAAINKFRGSIKLQFDFHRAIYNLGTVLYGLAEDTARTGGSVNAKELSHDELYSLSAVYIAAAYALKPNTSIYFSALKLVRSMLPLPFLKVGYLTAPPAGNPIAPHSDWKRSQFVLNNEVLLQVNKSEQRYMSQSLSSLGDTSNATRAAIKVNIPDIVSVSACADLTLPPGAGLWIETTHGPIFLVADSWEFLEGWLDAIRLVYTIFARGKSDVLAGIITG